MSRTVQALNDGLCTAGNAKHARTQLRYATASMAACMLRPRRTWLVPSGSGTARASRSIRPLSTTPG